MLLVSDELNPPPEPEEVKPQHRSDEINKDKHHQWAHGITPPLKNVRKFRFRKTLKRKDAELQEIENELKRLLRADSEAVNVKWEVITDDPKDPQKSVVESGEMDTGSEVGLPRKVMSRNLTAHDLFGDIRDIGSSSDEDDDQNEPGPPSVDMNDENDMALDFIE